MTKKHDELISIIKKDHAEVKEIFKKLRNEEQAAAREKLVAKLYSEIEPHITGEEESLYPALTKSKDSEQTALEALEEHHVAQTVLKELLDMPGNHERFQAKAAVLKELVYHHIEEEESEVFKAFKKVLNSEQAASVLDDFQKAKSHKKQTMETPAAMAA